MLLSIFRDFRVSTITGLDWTGLDSKCPELY